MEGLVGLEHPDKDDKQDAISTRDSVPYLGLARSGPAGRVPLRKRAGQPVRRPARPHRAAWSV